jgi:hypothetical protein
MSDETETDPQQQKQQQGKHDPMRSVNPSDTKPIPSPGNQSNPPQDISKRNPSQDSNSQREGQEKPEDQKRRVS